MPKVAVVLKPVACHHGVNGPGLSQMDGGGGSSLVPTVVLALLFAVLPVDSSPLRSRTEWTLMRRSFSNSRLNPTALPNRPRESCTSKNDRRCWVICMLSKDNNTSSAADVNRYLIYSL
eukprot:Pompholyxophrys_punicea_v1_NODE_21_length_5692_cov_19.735675.p5 type:complete len:119 gc:universal NODE_21_length_5692_cov_19.735675:785-429(-)